MRPISGDLSNDPGHWRGAGKATARRRRGDVESGGDAPLAGIGGDARQVCCRHRGTANFQLEVTAGGIERRGRSQTRMKNTLMNNPQHWRDRAEEARVNAEQMSDPESRRMMLEIADGYVRLAERAARRRESEKSK